MTKKLEMFIFLLILTTGPFPSLFPENMKTDSKVRKTSEGVFSGLKIFLDLLRVTHFKEMLQFRRNLLTNILLCFWDFDFML